MTKMYGQYHRDYQNRAGWTKSARRRIELEQAFKDDQYPSDQHIHGQVCMNWGNGCGDNTCSHFYWSLYEQDEWDTWTPLSVFETFPLIYTTES